MSEASPKTVRRGGGRRGVQTESARLVAGRGEFSGGIADADERADGGGASRRAEHGNEGRTVFGGDEMGWLRWLGWMTDP